MQWCDYNTYGVPHSDYYQQLVGWIRVVPLMYTMDDLRNVNMRNGKKSAVTEIFFIITGLILSLGSLMYVHLLSPMCLYRFVIEGVRVINFDGYVNPNEQDQVFKFHYMAVRRFGDTTQLVVST